MQREIILFTIIITFLEFFALWWLKSRKGDTLGIVGATLFYLGIMAILGGLISRHGNITVVNAVWQVMNVIIVTILGVVIFKEEISVKEGVALLFAFLAVLLINL